MLQDQDRIFKNLYGQRSPWLSDARSLGAWDNTKKLIELGKEEIIGQVKASGLRGRGGAGFLAGLKWSFMPKVVDPKRPHYFVVNADESEPGTCKDREIIRHHPHLFLEGCVLSSFAIGAHTCYIYIRGEYFKEKLILDQAVQEAYANKLLGEDTVYGYPIDVVVHPGAGAYICGEESALLESLEGKKGMPRLKPPFPAAAGLYGMPTTVNNVETVAVVPEILRRGSSWFASIGRPNNSGTKLFCISGSVNQPCTVEESLGVTFEQLVEKHAGGIKGGWNNLKAIIPGGSSVPCLPAKLCKSLTMDFDGLKEAGSSLGTAGVIVMNQQVDIVAAITRLSRFYMHESCGQCSPCREGTGWLYRMMTKIEENGAFENEIEMLEQVTKQMEGHTICALADAAAWPIQGLIRHFHDEMRVGRRYKLENNEVNEKKAIEEDFSATNL